MKSLHLARLWLTVAFLLLPFLQNTGASDLTDNLQAFRKKISAEDSKDSPDSIQVGRQFSMQIKMLENLIDRGNYDRAQQTLENLGNYGPPPKYQDEWMQLVDSLSKELEKRKSEELGKIASEVDRLVKEAKKACREAKTSDDLDALLMRCSILQMRPERNNGTVMGARIGRKLAGVSNTLSVWAEYLDFHEAGDNKKANDKLRNLRENSSEFPVLNTADIESRFVTVIEDTADIRSVLESIYKDVNSPDDLPIVLDRLKAYSANPLYPQLPNPRNDKPRLEAYIQAWKAAQAGDVAATRSAFSRGESGLADSQKYYAPIRAQIEARLIKNKTATWTKVPQKPEEDTSAFIGRIMDELKAKDDYATMLAVIDFSNDLTRGVSAPYSGDRQAIHLYLAGQRFESAEDGLAAVTSYRSAVAQNPGKYGPTIQAQEALKRLEAKYPEAFKNYEGVLVEQMRALSMQMQMLSRSIGMSASRPPGFPPPN